MVEEIAPAELKARLDDGDDVDVVDIRPARAFERGHVPGATNIPFSRFASAVDEQEWGDEVVIVCPKGESSLQAARLLESYEGIDEATTVANLEGGYREWEYELESGTTLRGDR